MKTIFTLFTNKLLSFSSVSSLLFTILFCIHLSTLLVCVIIYFTHIFTISSFLFLILITLNILLFHLFLLEVTINKEQSTLTNSQYELSECNSSDSEIEYDDHLGGNWASHPDGYEIGIPHKLYNPSDYELIVNKDLHTTTWFTSPFSKLSYSIKSSPFLSGSRREYHTDISESLNDLDISIGPRSNKPNYTKKDKASKEFNKNWINWNHDLSSADASLWNGGLKDILRSFWDKILTNNPSDHIVLLTLRLKMSYGSTRHVKYVSFFIKDDKMFNRIHFILNKEFLEKTEYLHTKDDEKEITGVVFRYQILAKKVNSVNENTTSEPVISKSKLPSISKSSSLGGKREYHTVSNNKRETSNDLINNNLEPSFYFWFLYIYSNTFTIILFIQLLCLILSFYFLLDNSISTPFIDLTCGTTFLSSIPLNVHLEEDLQINSHTTEEYDNYSDEDEEYPSPTPTPTPIRPHSELNNELDLDEEVSPEVIQAISDEIEADIDEIIERDIEMLQEELGDSVDLRVLVVYDDEDDSSDGPDSDANVLCDTSLVHGFQGDLDAEELAYYLAFFF